MAKNTYASRAIHQIPSRAFTLTCHLLACCNSFIGAIHSIPPTQSLPQSLPAAFQHLAQPRIRPFRTTSSTASTAFYPFSSSLITSTSSTSSRTFSSMESKTNNEVEDPLLEIGLPTPLILGSGSFTRKLILKEMGIQYELMVRPIDEKNLGDRSGSPHDLVSLLAKAKGDHLVSGIMDDDINDLTLPDRKEGWIVLTGDQVVTHDGSILEKPESVEEAKDFVSRYAKSAPRTVGACVLTHIPSMLQVSGVDSAQINFSASVADSDLIGKLLEEGAPVLDCAGGLMVEHPLVREHVEGIDGTEDSVMGLSKDLVIRLLKELKEKLKEVS